jgi:sigma-B regulation protein RsbU (phosphoserine phosphatase)
MREAARFSADALIAELSPTGEPLDDDATVLTVELLASAPGEETDTEPSLLFGMRLDATTCQLKPMREAVFAAVQAQGADSVLAHNIVLAVNEACMNIVQHAAPGSAGTQISLELLKHGATLIVHVVDDAPPIDVSKVEPRCLDDVRPGGLGVHFMREIMDQVEFLTPPAGFGNFLRMKKTIPPGPPATS